MSQPIKASVALRARALAFSAAVVLLVPAAGSLGAWTQEPAKPAQGKEALPPKPPPPDEPPPQDGGPIAYHYSTNEAIEFFQARIKKNPQDYVSLRYLGEMYERKAREAGDPALFERAEAALRKSLEMFPNSPRAQASLAAVLCSRHKFAEGLEIARKLVAKDPKDIDALTTLADALMELGRYDEAEVSFKELYRRFPLPEVLARLANLAESRGETEEAKKMMLKAEEQARQAEGPKAAAWYHARLGDMAFEAGQIEEAATLYESVPQGTDPYHDATAGLGRVRAAQGRLEEAIDLYKRAIAIGPDPQMLVALGDLYIRAEKPDKAQPLFDQLVQKTKDSTEYRRVLAMFYADHNRDLSRALELARLDVAERQDVHGHDALAWVLYKNDHAEEAAKSIAEALKLGTKDAKIFYHAGLIYLRVGDKDKARQSLQKALDLNPYFSPPQAQHARQTVAELDRK